MKNEKRKLKTKNEKRKAKKEKRLKRQKHMQFTNKKILRLIKNTCIRLRESKNVWISLWAIELAQKWVNEQASKPVSRWLSHYICGWASGWVILPNDQENECMSERVREVFSILSEIF